MGAASTRPSLRPLFFRGAKLWDHSGSSCREMAKLRLLFEKLIRCSMESKQSARFHSSCPGLSRVSTPRGICGDKDVDGRVKPGHDDHEVNMSAMKLV
jgi:hypothetical protein